VRAQTEISRGKYALALQLLQPASRYENASYFWINYLRGQAYLRQRAGAEAAVEFQKIIDHRGFSLSSALYPLAYLGLARASGLGGDSGKSRKAYQDFFALWKDADADLPVLIEAKKEYEKLK
jgi:predicted Zn-dependent protease